MQLKEFPAGEHRPGGKDVHPRGSIMGRLLHERFVIEADLTDHSLGGGFSVFLVKDLKNYSREAVLKIARSVPDDSGADGPSLKEVGDALIRIGHSRIEEIFETGRLTDGRPFAVAEPYRGTTLDKLIQPGRALPVEAAAELVEQVTQAVAAAHFRGILHCDLRPANILLPNAADGTRDIKIINFGLAWPIDVRGESLSNVQEGYEALQYAAPEMLVTLGHRSAVSDVYSFAVLAYRLLTGAVPYPGATRVELLEMIHAAAAARPDEVNPAISLEAGQLVMTGLDFEPIQRPQSINDFGLRLVRLLSPPKGILVAAPQYRPKPEPLRAAGIDRAELPAKPNGHSRLAETGHDASILFKPPQEARPPVSGRAITWILVLLLLAGALSIPIGQAFLKDKTDEAGVDSVVRPSGPREMRRLSYWFEPRNNTPPQTPPIESPGDSIAILADAPGYLYVFGEFNGDDDRPNYELIYPLDVAGKTTEAGKTIEAAMPAASQGRNPSAVWIIWIGLGGGGLEPIAAAARQGPLSNDADRRALRHFLERNRNLSLAVNRDPATGRTVLEGRVDRIVHRIDRAPGDAAPAPPGKVTAEPAPPSPR